MAGRRTFWLEHDLVCGLCRGYNLELVRAVAHYRLVKLLVCGGHQPADLFRHDDGGLVHLRRNSRHAGIFPSPQERASQRSRQWHGRQPSQHGRVVARRKSGGAERYRERRSCRPVGKVKANRQVAAELGLCEQTVETWRGRFQVQRIKGLGDVVAKRWHRS